MSCLLHRAAVTLVLLTELVAASPLLGQDSATTTVIAGPQYAAGGLKRFLFGSKYRAAWTTPIRVPFLDVDGVAGGLTATTAGGGVQTKSLRFVGADGYEYGFRSVDKGLANVPTALKGTFLEHLALDQNSAQHPVAALIAAPLARAAGLLHTEPELVVLPDDQRLGEHRERFKNTLGTFERRATIPPSAPAFAGAVRIIESDQLLDAILASPADRVDVQEFLKARLFDLWIGDRDRHRGQWTWALLDDGNSRYWVPIPEDRDQALVKFDGLVLSLARTMTGQLVEFEAGELLNFGEDYASIVGATWGGRELDRRLLVEPESAIWDSVARDLQARLTDGMIESAVRRLPPEYYVLNGTEIARALRIRRERLPEMARRFYRLLAEEPELHGTDAADLVTVERSDDGQVSVRFSPRDRPGAPYFARSFSNDDTQELRIFLHQGPDSVAVHGQGSSLPLRIVGSGDDVVMDSSTSGSVHLYSPRGTDRAEGVRHVSVDRRPRQPRYSLSRQALPPRDWGHQWDPSALFAVGPDIGLVAGGGPEYTRFGFWKYPYAYAITARAGIATGPPTGLADFRLITYRVNSGVRADLYVRGSGLDVLRFHGFGNDVELTQADDYYLVNQRQFEFTPTVVIPFLRHSDLRIGPTAQYNRTKDQPGRVIDDTSPYGRGNIGQIGMLVELDLDLRPRGTASTSGVSFSLGARAFPAWWDIDSAFTDLHGEAVAYLGSESLPLRPVLALRAGGKALFGHYPFYEAAFIGDHRTVRLGRQNRYGGDAAVYGNAELRIRLGSVMLLLPSEVGLFGLADVGRVYVEGESSSTWHTAFGGGIWFAVLDPRNAVHLAVARSGERTAVYLGFGFTY